ncbi:unnamed protein product, partial [Adineta ricciae]
GKSVNFFDCFIIDDLQYCRRPFEPLNLNRDRDINSCLNNGGQRHLYSTLDSSNISSDFILHEWRSSIERVEQYSHYRKDSSKDNYDRYICECIRLGTFGKNCEYQLPVGTTIAQAFQWHLEMKRRNPQQVQEFGDIVCYKDVECDSGQLCLDWREICDGIQHCMFGYDEKNCDLLELNQCEDGEYRCMNGMCIPDSFFLDGQYDCLDWSDELSFWNGDECYSMGANTKCDDHICPPYQFSCGDGQCLRNRFEFQQSYGFRECSSRREQYFICETSYHLLQWTLPSGRCLIDARHIAIKSNRTKDEQCIHLLKCALSRGKGKECPCWYTFQCTEILSKDCHDNFIRYPSKAIMGAYAFFLFDANQNMDSRLPRYVFINGTINCQGVLISLTKTIAFIPEFNLRRMIEVEFCREIFIENSSLIEPCYRMNDSVNVCNDSRRCLSVSRINDGFYSCLDRKDENVKIDIHESCKGLKSYRFYCSVNQPTCLSIIVLGNKWNECSNGYDELWFGIGQQLSEMNCNEQRTDECSLLRKYIEQSWLPVEKNDSRSQPAIPFHWYCDSFWDLKLGEDEDRNFCHQWWICNDRQWKCRTGQCIQHRWLSDREWDCTDASDEEDFFLKRIEMLKKQNSVNKSQQKFSICNKTHPFACLSHEKTSLKPYQCLSFNQIGDNQIDCLGSIDESNRRVHCDQTTMLGYSFKCASSDTCIPYHWHCQYGERCPNPIDDEQWCSHRGNLSTYDQFYRFTCFDEQFNSRIDRCDRELECSFGEDEYMCDYRKSEFRMDPYRQSKEFDVRSEIHPFELSNFPKSSSLDVNVSFTPKIVDDFFQPDRSSSLFKVSFWCNRGFGVLLRDSSIVCFCPPQYYGKYCQYHNDRLIFLFYLNLSQSIYSIENSSQTFLQILLLFFDENQVLMTSQFQVRLPLEINQFWKKTVHFVYSHSSQFRQDRMKRFFNRSNILHHHPYSIRIEIYEAQHMKPITLIAVWQYSIDFDYLPVFKLSKVLHLIQTNPCERNPCQPNQQCQTLLNDKSKYICLCQSNFTGPNCSMEDFRCKNEFCASNALCKPDYSSSLRGNSLPHCICPFNRYGDRCELEYSHCQINSCFNNGTCLQSSTLDQVICICSNHFYGSHCQYRKALIAFSFSNQTRTCSAIVIQYFYIDYQMLNLFLTHQQVYTVLPSFLKYEAKYEIIPEIVLAKVYRSYQDIRPNLYLLSLQINSESFEGFTWIEEDNRCPATSEFSMKSTSPIEYHQICITNTSKFCFHDDSYLCICKTDHTRAECFLYDSTLDRCSFCLAGGLCLKGNHILCLCPLCYSGLQCQFNSKSLTVTLDQLFYSDLISNYKQLTMNLIIIISILGFSIGLINNIFSFVTLHRSTCLQTGVGHYLFYMSIINQISLVFLIARLIHLSRVITDPTPSFMIHNILCKLLNYFLLCSIRISYWLTSFISVERSYTAIFLKKQWLKKPSVARRLMILTLLVILLSTSYELVFVKLFLNKIGEENSAICVMEFSVSHQTIWTLIHQTVSIVHSILPLIINICSTMIIIGKVINNKMNIYKTKQYRTPTTNTHQSSIFSDSIKDNRGDQDRLNVLRNVLNENKEMITRPMIALLPSIFSLFSLPILIISLSFACQTNQINQLRYLLIISYLISFLPQLVTFFLYIYPSTFYWKEWQSTFIMRRIYRFRQ